MSRFLYFVFPWLFILSSFFLSVYLSFFRCTVRAPVIVYPLASARPVTSIMSLLFLISMRIYVPPLPPSVTARIGGGRNDEMTDKTSDHRRGDRY
jgi:hypothetical protein